MKSPSRSERSFPLSDTQLTHWLAGQVDGLPCSPRVAAGLRLLDPSDVEALRRAFGRLVETQPMMRATVEVDEEGTPHNVVHEGVAPHVEVRDVTGLAPAVLEQVKADFVEAPHDPAARTWHRLGVFRGDDQDDLVWVADHLVADGWSIAFHFDQLARLYTAERTGEQVRRFRTPRREFAESVTDEVQGASARDFWRDHLRGVGTTNQLAVEVPDPRTPDALVQVDLDGVDVAAVASRLDAAPADVLLAALHVVVAASTGEPDHVVGAYRANRTVDDLATVGDYADVLPLRQDLGDVGTFAELVARTAAEVAATAEHGRLPLRQILDAAGKGGRPPSVVFGWQRATRRPDDLGPALHLGIDGVDGTFGDVPCASRRVRWRSGLVQLELLASQLRDGTVVAAMQHRVDLLHRETVERLASRLRMVLLSVAADPSVRIAELDVVGPAEGRLLDEAASGPQVDVEPVVVHELVGRTAEATPDAVAVVDHAGSWSHARLWERAGEVAALLQHHGVGPGDVVGLHVERSREMLAAVLGVLRAGAAYLPLDPSHPPVRLRRVMEDAGPALVLHDAAAVPADGTLPTPSDVLPLLDVAAAVAGQQPAPVEVGPDDLAYLIATSGSTGRPKCVEIPHGAVVNFLTAMRSEPGLAPSDRVLALTTLSFDISVLELLLPLLVGARTVVAPRDVQGDPAALVDLVAEHGVTFVQATPTTWRMLVDAGWDAPHVRALCGGEVLTGDLATALLSSCAEVWNVYGPTETTVWSTIHRVTEGGGRVAIGRPIANTDVLVVGGDGRRRPVGTPGELWIGGAGLARGYRGRPDLDAARFVVDASGERWYRTGDEVLVGPDGRLRWLRRLDDQVKVNGHRIELGDVETALREQLGVAEAVASVRQRADGTTVLAGYVVPEGPRVDPLEIGRSLRELLPPAMVPATVTLLDRVPLTTSGKVDRGALPEPDVLDLDAGAAPSTPLEHELVALWEELLGVDVPGVDVDFFDLRGDSVVATRLVARLRQRLGVEVSVRSVFEARTVRALATRVDQGERRAPRRPVTPVPRGRDHPLSPPQERMWFLQESDPDSTAYSVVGALRVRGALQLDLLQRSLDRVVARHETLRTTFPVVDGGPVQRIHDDVVVRVEEVDHGAAPDPQAAAAQAVRAAAAVPFDLRTGPLLRVQVHREGPEEFLLLLCVHHVIADQWAVGILADEVLGAYAAQVEGREPTRPALGYQYVDYAAWQREVLDDDAVLGEQLAYWREQLDGVPVLDLPADRPRPSTGGWVGALVTADLGAERLARLHAAAGRHEASPYMLLLACFEVVLHRHSGEERFTVGSPIANRHVLDSETLLASLVNPLVLRASVAPQDTLGEVVARVRTTALAAQANQDVPFERLVRELSPVREASRTPLFQVMFNVVNAPMPLPEVPGWTYGLEQVDRGAAQVDLHLSVDLARTGRLVVDHRTDLFDRARVERLLEHYLRVVDALLADPAVRVGELELLTEREREVAAAAGTGRAREVPPVRLEDLVADTVAEHPHREVVVDDSGSWTARRLWERAGEVAAHLQALGVGPGDVVGIHLGRGREMLAAAIGVHRAGAGYLPLDPTFPNARLAYMVEDAGASVLLCDAGAPWTGEAGAARVVAVEDVEGGVPAPVAVSPDDLAYVIYTSGSTGRPKGVEVGHRSVVNFLRSMADEPGLSSRDTLLAVTTLSFDISVLELWLPLVVGGRVVVAPSSSVGDPTALAALVDRHEVTVVQATPSTWRLLVEAGWRGPGVRVLSGGEALTPDLAAPLLERADEVWNMYGPTETTIWSTVHRVTDATAPVPIGGPIDNTTVRVTGPTGRAQPVGVPGELWIGGDGLALRYHDRPELTAERFPTDEDGRRWYRTGDVARLEDDGTLRVLGRVDAQVKVRGFRIELGEIEVALSDAPGVAAAAVRTWDGGAGDVRLAGYVVAVEGRRLDVDALRRRLGRTLPDYMVPATVTVLDALPLTPNGKVDRGALPVPSHGRARRTPPRGPTEVRLAAAWSEVLGVERVAREDDFFELGGHSLLILRLSALLDAPLPIRLFFEAPTLAAMAAALDAGAEQPDVPTAMVTVRCGRGRPVLAVAPHQATAATLVEFARTLDDDRPVLVLEPPGLQHADVPLVEDVVDVAAAYVEEVRTAQPVGPYTLIGYCSGAWIAYEMARQLEAAGERVHLVPVDTGPPHVTSPDAPLLERVVDRFRFYWRRGELCSAVRWQLSERFRGLLVRSAGTPEERRQESVRAAYDRALDRYGDAVRQTDPAPLHGPMTFIRSDAGASCRDLAWHGRWGELTTGPARHDVVPGTHGELLLGRSTEAMAAIVQDADPWPVTEQVEAGRRVG